MKSAPPPGGALLMAWVLLVLLAGCGPGPGPGPQAGDDLEPAHRIVVLAPHLAELAYAAGAGDRLVGAVEFSDQPPAARRLPRVGDAFRLDYEAIAALRPDLVLGWPSGNSPAAIARLQGLGYRVVALEPVTLDDIPAHIRRIGSLAGSGGTAEAAARDFEAQLAALRATHRAARPLRVFYQVAPEPLITVTRQHFIGQALEVCGGSNVFGELPGGAVTVGVEDVLAAAPDVIVANDFTAGTPGTAGRSPLEAWRAWRQLPAVRRDLLLVMDPDLMSVPGPRLLAGTRRLCAGLDEARQALAAPP